MVGIVRQDFEHTFCTITFGSEQSWHGSTPVLRATGMSVVIGVELQRGPTSTGLHALKKA